MFGIDERTRQSDTLLNDTTTVSFPLKISNNSVDLKGLISGIPVSKIIKYSKRFAPVIKLIGDKMAANADIHEDEFKQSLTGLFGDKILSMDISKLDLELVGNLIDIAQIDADDKELLSSILINLFSTLGENNGIH